MLLTPIRTSVLAFVVIAVSSTVLRAETPVLQVGKRRYMMSELFGVTKPEMKTQFLKDAKGLTDAELRGLLRSGPVKPVGRQALEEAAFSQVRNRVLDHAAMLLTLASISNSISKEYGIRFEDFFDTAVLSDAIKRQAEFLEFLYVHVDAAPDKAAELAAKASTQFQAKVKSTHWGELQKLQRRMKLLARWTKEIVKRGAAPKLGEYGLKAMLLHYMLMDACNNGIYGERATEYFTFQRSQVRIVELSGFVGRQEVLQLLAGDLADNVGRVRPRSEAAVRDFIRGFPRVLNIKISNGLGEGLCDGWTVPPIGVFSRLGTDRYRLLAWVQKAPSKGKTAQEKAGFSMFHDRIAYQMATARWLPEVKSFVQGWKPDVKRYALAAEQPGLQLVVGEVKVGVFVKKRVPGVLFKELEEVWQQLSEVVAEAAHVSAVEDDKAREAMVKRIDEKITKLKTEQAKSVYRAIKARL